MTAPEVLAPPPRVRLPDRQAPIRIVQLTDCHLGERQGSTLLTLDTDYSLQQVIRRVRVEQPGIDLLLATGDLADNGCVPAYRRLLAQLDDLCPRHFWLVGNHDNREAMASVVAGSSALSPVIEVGGWQILMLNSQIPGEVGGRLGSEQLEWLAGELERGQSAGLHTLVCLHHQPVAVGSAWIDEQQVSDSEQFLALLAQYSGVKAVLWGHVHQEIDRVQDGLRLLATPSTCVQFAPGSEDFMADTLPPGYRWLTLNADGSLETGVSRVEDVEFSVDTEMGGYLEK